jgi:hypothetical protein
MNEFPEWAKLWIKNQDKPVSHGLNLVLPLAHPVQLPMLLLDIVVAKPKIQRAMKELSFIHFARFVPSWDGRALMVTTEFDGPFEPYVMDFVIALGDVFDVLLSYVRAGSGLYLAALRCKDHFKWALGATNESRPAPRRHDPTVTRHGLLRKAPHPAQRIYECR